MASLNRRAFLAKSGMATALLTQQVTADEPDPSSGKETEHTLDMHIHLFGIGDNQSGCRLSKKITRGPQFLHLLRKLDIHKKAKTLDEGYVLTLAEMLDESGLDLGLILAQDAVYDHRGKPDWRRTSTYIPNDYLLRVVARYPQRMRACASINPDRADALDELERCAAKGAVAVKIHPPIQGVDIAENKHTKFFQRCGDLKIIVMVHTGHEHSAPVVDIELAHPLKLQLALEQGCTVVACHCGTGWPGERPDMVPDFLRMIRKYENLWGDTAVLGSAARVRDFGRLLEDDLARTRLLHGSDFPFPATPAAFVKSLGMARAVRLQAMRNPIQQDLALKEALGIGQASASRAYRICRRGK